jgi:hypothetical protein
MTKSLYRSFAGGEITPEMFGRIDLAKFQTGLRQCLNFITLPHGPAARRPGFFFVNEAKSEPLNETVRLVPFVFSATQAVMLEFGHQYVRFHNKAGTVLEAYQNVTPGNMTAATPTVATLAAHGLSNDQWVFCSSVAGSAFPLHGRFFKIANATANTFELRGLDGSVIGLSSVPLFLVSFARVYTLASPFSAADLASLTYAQSADVLTLTNQTTGSRELRRSGPTSWAFSTVSFAPGIAAPGSPLATETVAVATNLTAQHYKVTALLADLVTESLASVDATCTNNLTLAGNFNTISWSAVGSAARYYVYKQRGGTYGYIGQTTTLSLIDDNILADTTLSPPENNITLNTGAGDYPAALTYLERRRWFAGTANEPQNIWATRNGTESNLTSSVPSRDDDGMEFRIAAQQQNAVRHLVPLSDLIALTVGGEFRIFADGGPAIAPSTISIKPQGFSGAGEAQPALTMSSALYVQAQGSRIRELAYDPSGTGFYRSLDVSIMAPHLFNRYTIPQLAYTRAPESALWAIRSDGALLGMTYVPDQQVYGWHQHATDGAFESIAVIPEDGEDVLYAVVRRVINGRTVRYVERMTSRLFDQQSDAFYVDAGLTYDGAATTTITGLWHLEGKLVQVLADGAVVLGKTVTSGGITLPTAASLVHIGLGYNSDLTTLPLAYEKAPAAGQGTMKNVSKVYMRVSDSSVVKAGPTFDKLRAYPARQISDPYGSPPSLQTAEFALSIDPTWNTDGAVCVRQDLPLPLTLVAMALETQTGG